ncbi:MAG: MaoC family dehydratase [Actinomycetota bacterium]|nr:MaoC family dehydratase [Actinomycetota bacterium]
MDEATPGAGAALRTFADFPVGTEVALGSFTLSTEDIVAFASRYDPQPFHTDPEGAASGPFGGLIASGWQTAASVMRLYVDAMLADSDSRGSPGIENLRWLKPVRPDQVITAMVKVVDARVSATTKGRGTIVLEWEARNADGALVLSMTGRGLFGTPPAFSAGDRGSAADAGPGSAGG